jgi:hypothetical protein
VFVKVCAETKVIEYPMDDPRRNFAYKLFYGEVWTEGSNPELVDLSWVNDTDILLCGNEVGEDEMQPYLDWYLTLIKNGAKTIQARDWEGTLHEWRKNE